MAQQPNIEIDPDDLPRQALGPAPARRWSAHRPGDPSGPADVPWGGEYGTPGPDTGYAKHLLSGTPFPLDPDEDRSDVIKALAHVMAARASRNGRAPTRKDATVALLLFGLDQAGIPARQVARLSAARRLWVPRAVAGPSTARGMVAAIALDDILDPPEEIRARLAAGSLPLGA